MVTRFPARIVTAALVGVVLASCNARDRSQSNDGIPETTNLVSAALVGAAIAEAVSPSEPSACPEGMVLVDGEACPEVEQRCLEWLDPPGPYQHFRCARYASPAVCKSKARVHRRFCIDRTERTEVGSDLPAHFASWTSASAACKESGARLCKTSEWQFACEGEEMRPYPYGFTRDSAACNVDIDHGLGKIGQLIDHRARAEDHPRCVSPFGVHDMSGNVDEWGTVDGLPRGKREVMHGSWWMPGRNTCRSYQAGHDAYYAGAESGIRCCKDSD